jgi:hypothetical protein
MRLREYRFEPDTVQLSGWKAPRLAERPGVYPAIKIETGLGSFALVATTSRYDQYGQGNRRDVQIHDDARQVLRSGEATERTIDVRQKVWSGGAIIPLGQELQRKLSDRPHNVPPFQSAHLLDYSYISRTYGGVVQRAHLYSTTQGAYEMADIYDRYEDAYEPVMAIYPRKPNPEQLRMGEMPLTVKSMAPAEPWGWLEASEAGTLVVPSLLKTTYLTEG